MCKVYIIRSSFKLGGKDDYQQFFIGIEEEKKIYESLNLKSIELEGCEIKLANPRIVKNIKWEDIERLLKLFAFYWNWSNNNIEQDARALYKARYLTEIREGFSKEFIIEVEK